LAVVGGEFRVIVTLSAVFVHEVVIPHRKIFAPTPSPVTPDVGLFGDVIDPEPLTSVQVPVPVLGVLPASVAVDEHTDWSGPAFAESAPAVTEAVGLLLSTLRSPVAAEIRAVSVIVPIVPAFTFTTRVKLAEVLALIAVDFVQVTDPVPPTPGVEALHPDGVVTETKVVFAGRVSFTTTEVALIGPPLDARREYVMLFPAQTGFGLALFVRLRSVVVGSFDNAVGLIWTWSEPPPL
jgi:hypothetical protein